MSSNFIINNYVNVLKKYIEFEGRSSRPEFWWYILVNGIISLLLGSFISNHVLCLFLLAVLLPTIAVGFRRLNDAGFNPLLILLGLIPFGQLALIILWIMPSKK